MYTPSEEILCGNLVFVNRETWWILCNSILG